MERLLKKYKGLVFALVVVLVVFTIGGAIYFATRSTPQKTLESTRPAAVNSTLLTPKKALDVYCTALKNSDAQTLYDLQSASQQKLSIPEIQSSFHLADAAGGLKSCTIQSLQENSSSATGVVSILYKNGGNTSIPLFLKKNEKGIWVFSKRTGS